MEVYSINEMTKGWFLGNFEPSVIKTEDFEVAAKSYSAGDYEPSHYHKIAKEITVILSGIALMNNIEYKENDIIVIEPGESTDFLAKTDIKTVVVKIPSVKNDKFITGEKK
jgi:hypothetical protein